MESPDTTENKVRGRAKAAPAASNRTRVLVVNGHPITRIGLAHLINSQPDLVICDEAGDAAEALETQRSRIPSVAVPSRTGGQFWDKEK